MPRSKYRTAFTHAVVVLDELAKWVVTHTGYRVALNEVGGKTPDVILLIFRTGNIITVMYHGAASQPCLRIEYSDQADPEVTITECVDLKEDPDIIHVKLVEAVRKALDSETKTE